MLVLVWDWIKMPGWICSDVACVEQWGRTDILAQASSSRLGENTRGSPRVLPRALAQARGCVLSDRPARSGETASPKREFVKSSGTHCCRPVWARTPSLSEAAAAGCFNSIFFLVWLVVCVIYLITLFKTWSMWIYMVVWFLWTKIGMLAWATHGFLFGWLRTCMRIGCLR